MPRHPTVLGYVAHGTTLYSCFDKLTFQNNFPTLEIAQRNPYGKTISAARFNTHQNM